MQEQTPTTVAPEVTQAPEGTPVTQDQAQFLAKKPVELVQMKDGSITTAEDVKAMIESGQDVHNG